MSHPEIVAADATVILHDDNESMIAVARTGKNPTMRHLERIHGISIAWLHEMFNRDEHARVYELSFKMALEALTPSHDAESSQRQGRWWMIFRHFHLSKHLYCLRKCAGQA